MPCDVNGGGGPTVKPVAPQNSFLRPEAWAKYLSDDADREFLLEGVYNGFHIVDSTDFVPAEMENYQSATAGSCRDKVEETIREEITEGRYVVVRDKPCIVSALGAIPKESGSVRLIHDGSRPVGRALNDYAALDAKQRFQTLDDAADILSKDAYMAKVDLQKAYRSVRTHPSNWPACGLKWRFKGDNQASYMVDTALPFGSRHAPGIFHRLTQAVRRFMAKLGFTGLVVYLDDFLIIEKSRERCQLALDTLIGLLRELGFSISWHKVEGPRRKIVFLGVEIDSVAGCMQLPPDKLLEFRQLILATLGQKRISLRQLQHLAGKLNWASSVVRGGRIYLRRILDLMKPLAFSHHKALIPLSVHLDLMWWKDYLEVFNGKSWLCGYKRWVNVYVDACGRGAGIVWGNDWYYVNWELDMPHVAPKHINVKETIAIGLAVARWAPMWSGCSVTIHTDNITALCALNKGRSKSPLGMQVVRNIFWLSAAFDFTIRGAHVPGVQNQAADAVSRLHSPGSLQSLEYIFSEASALISFCCPFYFMCHMSYASFLFLSLQITRWLLTWRSWMLWQGG